MKPVEVVFAEAQAVLLKETQVIAQSINDLVAAKRAIGRISIAIDVLEKFQENCEYWANRQLEAALEDRVTMDYDRK